MTGTNDGGTKNLPDIAGGWIFLNR